MAGSATKTKILLIQVIDWLLFIIIVGGGIYGVLFFEENRFFAAVGALFGLAVVHQIGQWTVTQIALLRHKLDNE